MSNRVTQTSFLIPRRRSDLLTRPRLADLLTSKREYKLIQVIAPAGYGKTSFLVDFAQSSQRSFCWYTIDRNERELDLFLEHFLRAIAHCYPAFGSTAQNFVPGAVLSESGLEQLITVIVNEIVEKVEDDFIFVLDEFYLVDENPKICSFLSRFLQRVSENCQLVLVSRRVPHLPGMDLLAARSQVGEIGLADLAFQPEEIQALVQQNYHLAIPLEQARRYAEDTDGWIAGLILSPLLRQLVNPDRQLTSIQSGQNLTSFLRVQILDPLPGEKRHFLLRSSLFLEFDASLCEAVLGKTIYTDPVDWQQWLDFIVKENLFVLTFGKAGEQLRYASFFREFLQSCLEEELPLEKPIIQRRLAEAYRSQERYEEAYELSESLGDDHAVKELILQASPALIKRGALNTLSKWIDQLPAFILDQDPRMVSLRGHVALLRMDDQSALRFLDQAVDRLQLEGDRQDLAEALVRRSAAYQFSGEHQNAFEDAQAALSILEHLPDSHLTRAEAFRICGVCLHDLGNSDEALFYLKKAQDLYLAEGDGVHVARTQMNFGMVYRGRGEFAAAEKAYRQSLDFLSQSGDKTSLANVYNNLGVFHLAKGKFGEAARLFNRALEIARQIGYTRVEAFALISFSGLFIRLEMLKSAAKILSQCRQMIPPLMNRSLDFNLALFEAILAREMGEMDEAVQKLLSVRQLTLEKGKMVEKGQLELNLGACWIAMGNWDDALEVLTRALDFFQLANRRANAVQALFFLALVYHRLNVADRAVLLTRQAIASLDEAKENAGLVVLAKKHQEFLRVIQKDFQPSYLLFQFDQHVNRFREDLPRLRGEVRLLATRLSLPEPQITINSIGEPQVRSQDRHIGSSDWPSPLQQEIFFFILNHQEGVTRQQCFEALWPGVPDNPRLFNNAILRLRRLVGEKLIINHSNRYFFNRELDYQYDLELFQSLWEHAQESATLEEQLDFSRQLVVLYRGEFLPNAVNTWVLQTRQQLSDRYIHAALALARFHIERREYQVALDYCQRVLEKDAFQEEVVRLAMKSLAGLNNRKGIQEQFLRCVEAFKALGLTPSAETTAVYESLIR